MIVALRARRFIPAGAFLALALALPALATRAQAQEDKLPAAEKILDKSLQGMGGTEAFEKIHSRVSKGKFEGVAGKQTLSGEVTLYEAEPSKRYQNIKLPKGEIETGSDGDVIWDINGDKVTVADGDDLTDRLRQNHFNPLQHWRDLYEKVECVGKEQVNDHACYKVVLTPLLGSADTWYFDRKNGYLIRMDITRQSEQGPVAIQILLDDFKQIDGIWVPFKMVRVVPGQGPQAGAGVTYTYTWESIEQNTEIAADRFDLPDAVKEARDKAAKDKGKGKDKDKGKDKGKGKPADEKESKE